MKINENHEKCKSKDLKVYALEGQCAQVPRLPTETRWSVENIPCFDTESAQVPRLPIDQESWGFALWRVSVLKYHACQQKQHKVLKTYYVLTLRVLKYRACHIFKGGRIRGRRTAKGPPNPEDSKFIKKHILITTLWQEHYFGKNTTLPRTLLWEVISLPPVSLGLLSEQQIWSVCMYQSSVYDVDVSMWGFKYVNILGMFEPVQTLPKLDLMSKDFKWYVDAWWHRETMQRTNLGMAMQYIPGSF